MKHLIIIIFLLSVPTLAVCQTSFGKIDQKSVSVPDSLESLEQITAFLTLNLKHDTEKVRAIYIWITHNIKYDLDKTDLQRRYSSKKEIINEVLEKRAGICQHYSDLFHAMCQSAGIQSFVLQGYTRQADGKIADISHAWNAVVIGPDYFMIDATWAAGYVHQNQYYHQFRDNYFLIKPENFIKSHIPFDPIWQFLNNPLNNHEFAHNDFSKAVIPGNFMFKDSIKLHESLDLKSQLVNSNQRIQKSGITNQLIRQQLKENELQITNVQYNQAVESLNLGIENYNLYIKYKNKQFRNPKISDNKIIDLINIATKEVHIADNIINSLFSINPELNQLISDVKRRMPELILHVEKERLFVEKYTRKWKPLRPFMFLCLN